METERQMDNIHKLERMNKKKNEKFEFTERFIKQVDDFKIEDGHRVSMRDLNDIFSVLGLELSKVQLNELFTEM